ncbi:MAG: polymer-forming cytoskeletal protein [Acidobacteriota bacterium]
MSIFGKKPDQQPQSSSAPTPSSTPTPTPKPTPTPAPAPQSAAPAPAPSKSPQPGSAEPGSFLKAGCELVGEMSGAGSFECGGRFEGTIDIAGDLVVRYGGSAKAELKARRISIEGQLTGNATGAEKVEVGPSGHVEGDVRAPAVQFAEGAFFEGNVEMRRAKSKPSDAGTSDSAGDKPAADGGDNAAS